MVPHRRVDSPTPPESARGAAPPRRSRRTRSRASASWSRGTAVPEEPHLAAFAKPWSHLGYVEGQTVAIEYRYVLGRQERFPDLVADWWDFGGHLGCRVQPAAVAAKQATQAVPIVFIGGGDAVRGGLVASLARPGGNLTGLFFAFVAGFGGKWVELLEEAVQEVCMWCSSVMRAICWAQRR